MKSTRWFRGEQLVDLHVLFLVLFCFVFFCFDCLFVCFCAEWWAAKLSSVPSLSRLRHLFLQRETCYLRKLGFWRVPDVYCSSSRTFRQVCAKMIYLSELGKRLSSIENRTKFDWSGVPWEKSKHVLRWLLGPGSWWLVTISRNWLARAREGELLWQRLRYTDKSRCCSNLL